MKYLLVALAGAFIGWNLPQPPWAVTAQEKAVKTWEEYTDAVPVDTEVGKTTTDNKDQ